jgi:hypothetical protein
VVEFERRQAAMLTDDRPLLAARAQAVALRADDVDVHALNPRR